MIDFYNKQNKHRTWLLTYWYWTATKFYDVEYIDVEYSFSRRREKRGIKKYILVENSERHFLDTNERKTTQK